MPVTPNENSETLTMSHYPNLKISVNPYDPNPLELNDDTIRSVSNLESRLIRKIDPTPDLKGAIFLDSRGDANTERASLDKTQNHLYSIGRKHGGAFVNIPLPRQGVRSGFSDLNIARTLAAGHIIKKITDSRPNRRQIQLLKLTLPDTMSKDPQLQAAHMNMLAKVKQANTGPFRIEDLLARHIYDSLRINANNFDARGLLTHLQDPYTTMLPPYTRHFYGILSDLIQQHLKNRKLPKSQDIDQPEK